MTSATEILGFLQQPFIAMPVCAATVLAFLIARKPWTAAYVGLMPLINWSFAAVPTYAIPTALGSGPGTSARYVLGTSYDGWVSLCANDPSLVSSISPSLSASSLPT